MVLASQSQRRGSHGVYTNTRKSRRSRRRRRIIGVVVMLGLIGLGWSWLSGDDDSDGATQAVMADGADASLPASSGAESPGGAMAASARRQTAGAPSVTQRPAPGPAPQRAAPPIAIASAPGKAPAAPARTIEPGPDVADTPSPAAAPPPAARAESPAPPRPAPPSEISRLIDGGRSMLAEGKFVHARDLLNRALHHPQLHPAEAPRLRNELARINQTLIFSPKADPDDPWVESYVVQPGDALERIAKKQNVPWEFVSRINNNLDPRRMRVGARLKLIKGPFHAIVHKNDYRLDVYLDTMYVRSFSVGLGEYGSTPVGSFIVRRGSRLKNPEWTNPRTGEKYVADDPKNPLGEFWVGLRGTDANTEPLTGYGIHGTIEPQSVGAQASMGCIRMLADDIALIFALLTEEQSTVQIVN